MSIDGVHQSVDSKRKESQFWDWNAVTAAQTADHVDALNEKNLNSEIETHTKEWIG